MSGPARSRRPTHAGGALVVLTGAAAVLLVAGPGADHVPALVVLVVGITLMLLRAGPLRGPRRGADGRGGPGAPRPPE